jgi:dTDP-4-dehydrorhamnose 3,5-epimerase-like enzyme
MLAMQFTETRVAGAWIIEPSPYRDEPGHFMRAWCVRGVRRIGKPLFATTSQHAVQPAQGDGSRTPSAGGLCA